MYVFPKKTSNNKNKKEKKQKYTQTMAKMKF